MSSSNVELFHPLPGHLPSTHPTAVGRTVLHVSGFQHSSIHCVQVVGIVTTFVSVVQRSDANDIEIPVSRACVCSIQEPKDMTEGVWCQENLRSFVFMSVPMNNQRYNP